MAVKVNPEVTVTLKVPTLIVPRIVIPQPEVACTLTTA